jgi:hypothetical protein
MKTDYIEETNYKRLTVSARRTNLSNILCIASKSDFSKIKRMKKVTVPKTEKKGAILITEEAI